MLKRRYIALVFIISYLQSFSQSAFTDGGSIHLDMIGGYNVASNNVWRTKQNLDGYIGGFEIGYSKFTNGTKEWQADLGKPRIGINFQTILMNHADTFGRCYSILPSIEIRALTYPKSELDFKIAIGATYCTKTFNQDHNFDNRAISSPINFGLEFSAIYHHQLGPKTELNLEASFFHVSNGEFSLPNGGYNLYFGKAGINYYFDNLPYHKRVTTFLHNDDKAFYSGYVSFAYRKEGTVWDQREYPVFNIHQAYSKKVNKITTIGIGMDLFYDASLRLARDPNLAMFVSDVKEIDKINAALGFCYSLDVGKMSFPFELYHYIYNLKQIANPMYIRFGVKYEVWKELYVGSFVKGGLENSSSFKSAFMEFAIGWSFRRITVPREVASREVAIKN